MKISRLSPGDTGILKQMLFEALYVPTGSVKPDLSALDTPWLSRYYIDWNKMSGDLALVARIRGQLAGAIWGRMFQPPNIGYGFIADDIPEIAMAVLPPHRNKGIGTALLINLENEYSKTGVTRLSLSVDERNPARRLYERNGYEIHSKNSHALTMLKDIRS